MKQRAFVRDDAAGRGKVKAEANNANKNWDFNGIVFAEELATSGVRGKWKEFQRFCKFKSKAVLACVFEKGELSWKVFDTKHDNTKLINCNNDLVKELEDVQCPKRLVCDKLEVTLAFV